MYQVKTVSRNAMIAVPNSRRKLPGQVLDEHLAAGWEPIGCTTTLTPSLHGGYDVDENWALRRRLPGCDPGVVVRLPKFAGSFGPELHPDEGTVPVYFGGREYAVAVHFGMNGGSPTARIRLLNPLMPYWPGDPHRLRAVERDGVLVRLEGDVCPARAEELARE